MEIHSFQILFGDFLNVATVLGAEYDIGYTGAFGSQDLLADTAYGQNLAAQRYLTGHGQVCTHLTLCEGRCN